MTASELRLTEFKRLVARCVEIVRTKDTGTRYRDSAAGLEHMHDVGPVLEPLSPICTITARAPGTA
jgi:hypothetical protein